MTDTPKSLRAEMRAAQTVDRELRGFLDGAGKTSTATTVRVRGGDWTTVQGLLERAYEAGRADATHGIVERLERWARWSMLAAERVWSGSGYQDEQGMAFYAHSAGALERAVERIKPAEPPIAPPLAEPIAGPSKDDKDALFVEQYPGMADLVRRDQQEVVYPRGVPTVVPRGVCRCPILNVGDFCPVHGG